MWQKLSGSFPNQTFPPPIRSRPYQPSLSVATASSPPPLVRHRISSLSPFGLSLSPLLSFSKLAKLRLDLSRWILCMETPSNENSEHSITPSNDAVPNEDNIVPEATNHGYIPLPLHVLFIIHFASCVVLLWFIALNLFLLCMFGVALKS